MSEMLEQLRTRERDMELEAITLRARVEELRRIIGIIELLEQQEPVRRRQPRGGANVTVVNKPGGLPWADEETAA